MFDAIKRVIVCAMLIVTITGSVTTSMAGQKGRRSTTREVKFERGRTTAVLRGTARAGFGYNYILRARAGQTMSLNVVSKDRSAYFSILTPSSDRIDNAYELRNWSGKLPESGEYVIVLDTTNERNTPFTLEVTIR